MNESPRWGSLQYLTLLLVMMAHTALLVWLMMAARAREGGAAASESVQLVLLQPRTLPRIRMDSVQPRRIEIRRLPNDSAPFARRRFSRGNGARVPIRIEGRRRRCGLGRRSAAGVAGLRNTQPSARRQQLGLEKLARGTALVAGPPPRRTRQDRGRQLDRLDQLELLSGGHVDAVHERLGAPAADRLPEAKPGRTRSARSARRRARLCAALARRRRGRGRSFRAWARHPCRAHARPPNRFAPRSEFVAERASDDARPKRSLLDDELIGADEGARIGVGEVLAVHVQPPGILGDADRGVGGRVRGNLEPASGGGDRCARQDRGVRAGLRE